MLPAPGVDSIVNDSKNNLLCRTLRWLECLLHQKSGGKLVLVGTRHRNCDRHQRLGQHQSCSCRCEYHLCRIRGLRLVQRQTTNGGATWTRKTALTLPADYGTDVAVAATTTKIVTLVTRTGQKATGTYTLKVLRSNVNGVSWCGPSRQAMIRP